MVVVVVVAANFAPERVRHPKELFGLVLSTEVLRFSWQDLLHPRAGPAGRPARGIVSPSGPAFELYLNVCIAFLTISSLTFQYDVVNSA